MGIKRERVESSAIRSVGHDDKKKKLGIEFRKSGAVYEYSGVSKRAAGALVNASSIGKKFNKSIRNDYPYERVRGGTPKRGAKKHR